MNSHNQSMRSHSLDALRGFAILTMVLSGVIPYGVLPPWMYHAQIPPPDHRFNPQLPGLTWVDLVFPMFLFALGAAIPFALSRRREQGDSAGKIMGSIVQRGFLLGFFAIFLRHVRPHVLQANPQPRHWLIALAGFALMFPIFARLPGGWPRWKRGAIRSLGWLVAVLMIALLRYPDGSGFSLNRSDIIIVVLANMAVFGSLVWLVTRNNILLRLGVLAALLALRLSSAEPGWVQTLWNFSPAPWIFKLYYLQYLFIVIPGTLVGDVLSQPRQIEPLPSELDSGLSAWWLFLSMLVATTLVLLIGLQSRWLWQTAILTLALTLGAGWLIRRIRGDFGKVIRLLFNWGACWLWLGLLFEPYEGGIKKDHSTLSYYFVTAGISTYALIAFSVVIDLFKKQRWVQLLIDNGKNPMIAYVAFANFIWPILALSGAEKIMLSLTPTPWLGFFRGLFYTALLALLVSLITRKKIYWRT
ncbi:MAG: DUF5009 domain-containing protein [Candidatus Zhuqueibacterota bacterium]